MEEINFKKIENIFKKQDGYITRKDIDKENIPSWFLYDFVKKNKLNKIAPGVYVSDVYIVDDYFIFQKRYPKYVYSGISALYLHNLTDKIVTTYEVAAPHGYNPTRHKIDNLIVHRFSNKDIYSLGITEVKTMFGNVVRVYDVERTICDIIKNRDDYDSETFIKAIKWYAKRIYNQSSIFKYAKIMRIEKQVYEIFEVLVNEN